MVTQRVPSGELSEISELSLAVQLTQNAESVPPGVFAFIPSVLCGLRRATPTARCLCIARVTVRIPVVPLAGGRFRAKLSDSLVGAGRGVNTQFPFGVLVFESRKFDWRLTEGERLLDRTGHSLLEAYWSCDKGEPHVWLTNDRTEWGGNGWAGSVQRPRQRCHQHVGTVAQQVVRRSTQRANTALQLRD
jgi:hypothetical protein